jgi:hypothetical protein
MFRALDAAWSISLHFEPRKLAGRVMQITTTLFPGPFHLIPHRMSDESVLRMVNGYGCGRDNGLPNVTISAFPQVAGPQQPISEPPLI